MARKKDTLRSRLAENWPREDLEKLKTAFDIIGDIAVLEIDPGLRKREKEIGSTLLGMHRNLKVVCRKEGTHEGEFRLQRLKVIAGEKRTLTEHRENGCRLIVDLSKAYFSPRLSTERKRIFTQVREGEVILIMFSGVGPYPIEISRNSQAKEIYAIEKNPEAHYYAEKNTLLNKASNIRLFKGDVRDVAKRLRRVFDRILMPLPRGGEDYLGIAFRLIKKGGIVHFYDFLGEGDLNEARKKVLRASRKAKRNIRVLCVRKCGQSAPRFYRVVVDFRVVS